MVATNHRSPAPSQGAANRASGHGQDQTFEEQLAQQSTAAGTDSGAQSDFPLASTGSREKQVSDVTAGKQQDHGHGGDQSEEHVFEVGDDCVGERFRNDRKVRRIVVGILLRNVVGDDVQICCGLLQRNSQLASRGGPYVKRLAMRRRFVGIGRGVARGASA